MLLLGEARFETVTEDVFLTSLRTCCRTLVDLYEVRLVEPATQSRSSGGTCHWTVASASPDCKCGGNAP